MILPYFNFLPNTDFHLTSYIFNLFIFVYGLSSPTKV